MKHYGDITKISGYDLPIVDIITGGSPCQDLSVAGKRAGLSGERSGLFMEQIRIVKEMRDASKRTDKYIRPRYMVWENVPGALSSNGGKDFQAVLTEIVRIADSDAPDVPLFGIGGGQKRWTKSGCLYDQMGRWSIAWRIHDAQFWGVPQRRKRIAVVADFGGLSAPEILFERKGLSRDSEPGESERETTSERTGRSPEKASGGGITFRKTAHPKNSEDPQGWETTDTADTLNVYDNSEVRTPVLCLQGNCIDRADTAECNGKGWTEDVAYTLNTIDRHAVLNKNVANTLGADDYKEPHIVLFEPRSQDGVPRIHGDVCPTLNTAQGGQRQPCVSYQEVTGTLSPGAHAGSYNGQDAHNDMLVVSNMSSEVRRLTPTECERLQNFPDDWTNLGDWVDSKGKKHKDADSPRYKALGNSIALPFWRYLARRIVAQYEHDVTMGSLFDGLGGFPLVFEQCGAKAVWASEIEEFCIAVTKRHFPEDMGGND